MCIYAGCLVLACTTASLVSRPEEEEYVKARFQPVAHTLYHHREPCPLYTVNIFVTSNSIFERLSVGFYMIGIYSHVACKRATVKAGTQERRTEYRNDAGSLT